MTELEVYPRSNVQQQSTVVYLSLFLILLAFPVLFNGTLKLEETRAGSEPKSSVPALAFESGTALPAESRPLVQ